jgi:hypothetical protein
MPPPATVGSCDTNLGSLFNMTRQVIEGMREHLTLVAPSRARLMAARSSQDLASCARETLRARWKYVSAFA